MKKTQKEPRLVRPAIFTASGETGGEGVGWGGWGGEWKGKFSQDQFPQKWVKRLRKVDTE